MWTNLYCKNVVDIKGGVNYIINVDYVYYNLIVYVHLMLILLLLLLYNNRQNNTKNKYNILLYIRYFINYFKNGTRTKSCYNLPLGR